MTRADLIEEGRLLARAAGVRFFSEASMTGLREGVLELRDALAEDRHPRHVGAIMPPRRGGNRESGRTTRPTSTPAPVKRRTQQPRTRRRAAAGDTPSDAAVRAWQRITAELDEPGRPQPTTARGMALEMDSLRRRQKTRQRLAQRAASDSR